MFIIPILSIGLICTQHPGKVLSAKHILLLYMYIDNLNISPNQVNSVQSLYRKSQFKIHQTKVFIAVSSYVNASGIYKLCTIRQNGIHSSKKVSLGKFKLIKFV